MKRRRLLELSLLAFALISCGSDKNESSIPAGSQTTSKTEKSSGANSYDPTRGIGQYDVSNVDLSTFDPQLAAKGKGIADVKCMTCHKTTDEKLVGPGWKGITKRQTPHWILNFISNPDPMLDVDPELQKQLELCLVRMPNQALADTEARQLLEYMREIDGTK
ncbi:c-type cytochrome [Chryseobacterium sp. A301]